MAALARLLLTAPQTSPVAVRCASRKSGGSSKNLGGRSPGKCYGFKKVEGLRGAPFLRSLTLSLCRRGLCAHRQHLATQRLIRWHPGAHVGMGCNKTLYALEDRIVRYTREVYVPLPRGTESREVICRLPKGAVLYKTFISVIPTREVGSYKLVTML